MLRAVADLVFGGLAVLIAILHIRAEIWARRQGRGYSFVPFLGAILGVRGLLHRSLAACYVRDPDLPCAGSDARHVCLRGNHGPTFQVAAEQAVAAAERNCGPRKGGHVSRRHGLRPRLLAAVVRSNATLAFAAERQVVGRTRRSSRRSLPGEHSITSGGAQFMPRPSILVVCGILLGCAATAVITKPAGQVVAAASVPIDQYCTSTGDYNNIGAVD